ncbi:hypothetical protein BC833DRAFT_429838 [Globomyces pollinis-pini]|nr:hypothetical protein BC833DRAFT_429838 [Globomyces pollinis-pini]
MKLQLILATLISYVLALQKCADVSNTFCVNGVTKDGMTTFTIHSSEPGWAGIGLGKEMKDSHIIVGWINGQNTPSVVSLLGEGHSLPKVAVTQQLNVVPLADTKPSWSKLSFSFTRPVNTTFSGTIASNSDYIWAMGSDEPSNKDNIALAAFKKHTSKGSFQADFTKNAAWVGNPFCLLWVVIFTSLI